MTNPTNPPNSRRPMVGRATSHRLDERMWLVDYRGGTFLIKWSEYFSGYKIYRRGVRGHIHTIVPKNGLGKEEAIQWIEDCCW